MQWLYLYFPQLQLDRLQALTPSLAQHATVLFQPQERLQPVLQKNQEAVQAGVQTGMPLAKAWLLTEKLYPLAWREYEQVRLLRQLAAHLYQGFSDIFLDTPDGLWLNLQPLQRIYPTEALWQRALQELLAPFQVQVWQARHSAPLAARLLARHQLGSLDALPVSCLPCEEQVKDKLIRFGVTTVAALREIPRAELGKKLGLEVVILLSQLEGQQSLRLAPYQPPQSFYQRVVLPAEAAQWQGLQFSLKRLLSELERFLIGRGKAATQLSMRLYFRELPIQNLLISAPHGCVRAREFMALCQLKMEHEKLPAPVIELSLQAQGWKSHEVSHADLWQKQTLATVPLNQLLNQLQLRMGVERVQGLQVQPQWLPEYSWRSHTAGQPLLAMNPNAESQSLTQRPAWLCLHPQRVQIAEWQLGVGPERIRTSWWQTGSEGLRDYYQAQHLSGRVGWLFYCYQQRSWWLHGWFS